MGNNETGKRYVNEDLLFIINIKALIAG